MSITFVPSNKHVLMTRLIVPGVLFILVTLWFVPLVTSTNPEVPPDDCEPSYTLTVEVIGNGSVLVSPMQLSYGDNTTVKLNASADPGWVFDYWQGDLLGSENPTELTMDENKTVVAYFIVNDEEEPIVLARPSHYAHSCTWNVRPVARAGGPYEALLSESISFDGSGSYDADGFLIHYFWSFGDGTTGAGATVEHQYLLGGIYEVTLTVVDNFGGSASNATVVHIVLPNHPPSNLLIGGPSEGVKTNVYSYVFGAVDPDNDDITYHIDWGDGTIYQIRVFSSDAFFMMPHQWNLPGTYTVTMIASDGTLSASSEKMVTIHNIMIVSNLAIFVLCLLILLVLLLIYIASKRKKKHE